MIWKYPDEVGDYIAAHVSGTTTRDLTAQLNEKYSEKYGIVFTESRIKSYKKNHNLKSGTRCGKAAGFSSKYGPEVMQFIQDNAAGRSNEELAEMVKAKFNISFTAENARAFKARHKIRSGIDCRFQTGRIPGNKGKKGTCSPGSEKGWFQKGNKPVNTKKVGTYSHTTDGYLIRKVKESGNQWEKWEFVHIAVWEEHNGPVPDGMMITFLDGNKDNCSIENLAAVTNNVNLELNRRKLRFENPDLTSAGINLAKLNVEIRRREKR